MRVDSNFGGIGHDRWWWCEHWVLGEGVIIVIDVFGRFFDFASMCIAPAVGHGTYHAGANDDLIEAGGNRWRNAMTFC